MSSCCRMRMCCGNVFTGLLPSSLCTCHNIVIYTHFFQPGTACLAALALLLLGLHPLANNPHELILYFLNCKTHSPSYILKFLKLECLSHLMMSEKQCQKKYIVWLWCEENLHVCKTSHGTVNAKIALKLIPVKFLCIFVVKNAVTWKRVWSTWWGLGDWKYLVVLILLILYNERRLVSIHCYTCLIVES
jgi:hypothetical protein